ncbi:hypothetical protein B0H13DRAFT_1866692 [Mycena leptocephala]|nr:hypothetical protein B0H13DRAFT_1866692 [Mycena leptocephala]
MLKEGHRTSPHFLSPDLRSQFPLTSGEMSNFYSPLPDPAPSNAPGKTKNQKKITDTQSDSEDDDDSSETEMSDGGPRRVGRRLRLTGSNKALIRFLSNRKVQPSEIRAHPKCGWVIETINRYKKEDGRDDERYITPEFDRILAEIKETKKNKELNMSQWELRKRGRANIKRRQSLVATQTGHPHHRPNFLHRFVLNAGLNPECAEMLKEAGFTAEEKLFRVAGLGKEEVDKFVKMQFPKMTAVDKVLFVEALLRLAMPL